MTTPLIGKQKTHRGGSSIRFGGTLIFVGLLVLLSLKGSVPPTTTLISSSSDNSRSTMARTKETQAATKSRTQVKVEYSPSTLEAHVMRHADDLELNSPKGKDSGCEWMHDSNFPIKGGGANNRTTPHSIVQTYTKELNVFHKLQKEFTTNVTDLRKQIAKDGDHRICDTLQLHPEGLSGLFSGPGSLSHAPTYGFVEPLLPPMRHLSLCQASQHCHHQSWFPPLGSLEMCAPFREYLMDTEYLLHDFAALCRQLRPNSKTIFLDMGAALDFHGPDPSPVISQIDLFNKFGFDFDHIYAFEIVKKDPTSIFQDRLPQSWLPKYHWINQGVSADLNDRLHPFQMLQSFVQPEDFVVVKLDIDTPHIELPLSDQLLSDDENDFASLVDVMFFEHHVRMKELWPWRDGVQGTIKDSMALFQGLRERGIAAHSWV